MSDLEIRPPKDEELAALAGLRWQWMLENGETPAIGRDEFVTAFATWAREHSQSHHCLVLAREDAVIGMAWLAILPRVPTPARPRRATGDVQSVYVVPGERDRGHGSRLLTAILELAGELGVERVTVHSTVRAIPAYSRLGFANSPRLLQIQR